MEDFSAARAAKDYPNAIAIWDSLAEQNFASILAKNNGKYNSSLPAIFSSFMPKSGGTFLFNRMIESLGYLDFYWGITPEYSHSEVYPTSSSIDVYRKGGLFCHTHAIPSPYVRMMFREKGVSPVWVHVRDPAEVALAGFYHYQGVGQGEGAIWDERIAEMSKEKSFLNQRSKVNFESREQFMRQTITFHASWLNSWLEYAEDNPRGVFFTYFDELDDTRALLKRVLLHYDCDFSLGGIADDLPQDRRRKSGIRDWREGLSDETIEIVSRWSSVWERALALRK